MSCPVHIPLCHSPEREATEQGKHCSTLAHLTNADRQNKCCTFTIYLQLVDWRSLLHSSTGYLGQPNLSHHKQTHSLSVAAPPYPLPSNTKNDPRKERHGWQPGNIHSDFFHVPSPLLRPPPVLPPDARNAMEFPTRRPVLDSAVPVVVFLTTPKTDTPVSVSGSRPCRAQYPCCQCRCRRRQSCW